MRKKKKRTTTLKTAVLRSESSKNVSKLGRCAVDGQIIMKSPSENAVFLWYYMELHAGRSDIASGLCLLGPCLLLLARTEVRGLSREKGLYELTSHETNSQLPQSLPLNSFHAARNLQSVRRNNPGPVSNTSALVSRLFYTAMSVSMTPKETK